MKLKELERLLVGILPALCLEQAALLGDRRNELLRWPVGGREGQSAERSYYEKLADR